MEAFNHHFTWSNKYYWPIVKDCVGLDYAYACLDIEGNSAIMPLKESIRGYMNEVLF